MVYGDTFPILTDLHTKELSDTYHLSGDLFFTPFFLSLPLFYDNSRSYWLLNSFPTSLQNNDNKLVCNISSRALLLQLLTHCKPSMKYRLLCWKQ